MVYDGSVKFSQFNNNFHNDKVNEQNHINVEPLISFKPIYNPDGTFTVQQAVNAFGFGWFHVKLSLLIGLCWMADSMEMTILSIIGPSIICEWKITKFEQSLLVTVVFLGMMISSFFWTKLSDRYGRKPALTLFGVLLVLYSILSAVAPNFAWLVILKALIGFTIGCVPQSVTLYAEFLPSKHKGKCVVLMDCFWALGACFELLLALVTIPLFGWRTLLALSACPLLLFTLLTPWLPESARFFALTGRNEKAVQVLQQIARNNKRHMITGRLITDIEPINYCSISSLLYSGFRKTTILLWLIWWSCAFCYYGIVLLSTELTIMRRATSSNSDCESLKTDELINLLWITLSEFPGIFLTIFAIQKCGKKITMLSQFFVYVTCIFLLSVNLSAFMNGFILFIGRGVISGLFQSAYMYTPDVYPSHLRSVGVGGCSTFARVGAMLTPFVAQVMMQSSPNTAIACYGAIGIVAAVSCFLLP